MMMQLKPLAGSILLLLAGVALATPVQRTSPAMSKAAKTQAQSQTLIHPGKGVARGDSVAHRIGRLPTATRQDRNAAPVLSQPGGHLNGAGGKLPLGPLGDGRVSGARNGVPEKPTGVSLTGPRQSPGLPDTFRDPRGDPAKKRSGKVGQQSSGGAWFGSDSMTDRTDGKGNQHIVREEKYEDDNHSMHIVTTHENGKESQDIVYKNKKTGEVTREKSETPADKPKDPPPPEKPKDPPPPPEKPKDPPPSEEPSDDTKTPLPDGVDGGSGNRGVMEFVQPRNTEAGNKARKSLSQPVNPDAGVRSYNLSGLSKASHDPKARLAPWIMPSQESAGGASNSIPVPVGAGPVRVNMGTSLKDPGPLGDPTFGPGASTTSGLAPR